MTSSLLPKMTAAHGYRPDLLQIQFSQTRLSIKKPPCGGFYVHICKKNYFGAEAAAAAGAEASMAGAEAASTAGAGAATGSGAGATTGAGAGAGASSFLPQAARAKAATKAAKTRDLFISLSLKLKKKTISGNCQNRLGESETRQRFIDRTRGLELFYPAFDYSPD